MKIHKESYNIIFSQIMITILIGFFMSWDNAFIYYVIPIFIIIILFTLYFFRIPDRNIIHEKNSIYSPCDGKIVIIEKVTENEYFKDERIQVSIFMSPLNVHNQLHSINGEVKYKKYHPGKYLVAWHPKSSLKNERCTIVTENKDIIILCRQIAGAVARRIKTYVNVGDSAKTGQEYGFIKFGSRVDLFLPTNVIIKSKIGDKVKGGIDIIGLY